MIDNLDDYVFERIGYPEAGLIKIGYKSDVGPNGLTEFSIHKLKHDEASRFNDQKHTKNKIKVGDYIYDHYLTTLSGEL